MPVPMAEITSDLRQPARLEKKTNISRGIATRGDSGFKFRYRGVIFRMQGWRAGSVRETCSGVPPRTWRSWVDTGFA